MFKPGQKLFYVGTLIGRHLVRSAEFIRMERGEVVLGNGIGSISSFPVDHVHETRERAAKAAVTKLRMLANDLERTYT